MAISNTFFLPPVPPILPKDFGLLRRLAFQFDKRNAYAELKFPTSL